MHLQLHRLLAPYELTSAPREELELLERSEEDWVRVARRWSDRTRTVYEIDEESGRIRRIVGEIEGEDGDLLFISESHDLRTVDGILFPFRTTTMISGRIAAETVLERLTLEERFEPEEFQPVGAPADL